MLQILEVFIDRLVRQYTLLLFQISSQLTVKSIQGKFYDGVLAIHSTQTESSALSMQTRDGGRNIEPKLRTTPEGQFIVARLLRQT